MIRKVTVYKDPANRLSDFFTVYFTDPPICDRPYYSNRQSPLAITKIDGLGPVDADVNMSEMAVDGDLFNSARIGKRNIVIDYSFCDAPNWTVESARHYLYGRFPTKSLVYIEVETDEHTLYTKGYVEKVEPSIFDNPSGVQVSILCPDPKWYDADGAQTVTFENYATHIFYTDQDVMDVSGILTITLGQDVAPPNVRTPFLRVWSATQEGISPIPIGAGNEFEIYVPSSGFSAGDVIKVSGIPGNKYCTWTDTSDETHDALYLLNKNPEWIVVSKGKTLITLSGSTEAIDSATFEYTPCYKGV